MKATEVVLLVVLAVITVLVSLHFYLLDGLDGLLLSALFEEDTVYATGYSDSDFRRIRAGMTKGEVTKLLGPPIDEFIDRTRLIQRWSKSAHDSSYRTRVIHFENHIVVEKLTGFYVD